MATKKPIAKKATTRKSQTSKKPATKKPATKKATTKLTLPAIRRPDQNLPPDIDAIDTITEDILYLINYLDDYAANLRALDRKRHNGVGIHRLGFIEAAFRLSTKFPQYFPHWLTTAAKKPSAFWLGVCA